MTPIERYRAGLAARRSETARWRRLEARLGSARLAVAGVAALLLWLVAGPGLLGPAWLLLPVAGFGALVVLHVRASGARRRSLRAEAFHEQGIRRLEDRWAGRGIDGERFRDDRHPYAPDLDLFGPGSVFERLCTARTRAGEETLAAWLGVAAEPEEIRARQVAMRELAPDLDGREELALLGEEVSVGIHPDELGAWGNGPPALRRRWVPVAALALSGLAVAALVLGPLLGIGLRAFALVVVAEALLAMVVRREVAAVLEGADRGGPELDLLARLLGRVERERFEAPRLREIVARLEADGQPPSRRIASLRRLVALADARRNQLFAPIGGVLLWGTQVAHAIERWRARSGPLVAEWLSALGELEALLSLAAYAFERPEDPDPEIVEDGPTLEGEALGHPLLPDDRCVRNDVAFSGDRRLFLVSGSNMSGKSTWLRTVGVNAVLALAGAPVCAGRLRISPLLVSASMRSQDSLLDGRSRFYAEIERLRQVVDRAGGEPPALFLLDELLHGTNSHDRAIGAEGVIRELVRRGAIGMVTTHDLALARIADALGGAAANVHFEDRLEDGRMVFDYRLRDGVVTKSNALDLMRAVGLDV